MKIIVIGAGFSGLSVIKSLKKIKSKAKIILFDKNLYTSMLPSLPDLACGKINKKYLIENIQKILPKNIIFKNEEILNIDLFNKKIKSEKYQYTYDHLVIASGSVANFYGFKNNINNIYKLESILDAVKIKENLIKLFNNNKNINIVLSGAGYTGLELAANLRYFLKKNNKKYSISLIQKDDDILHFLNNKQKDYIKSYLEKENIKIIFNSKVTNFNGNDVVINNFKKIENTFLIWAAGTKFSINDINGDFNTIGDGRIITNDYLQLPNHLEVFAVGDSAAIKSKNSYIRKAVDYSVNSGSCAGKNIVRIIKNEKLKEFVPFDLGWVIPLHKISIGKLFNLLSIKGKIGLRLHYFLCGYRNYNLKNFIEYLKISLKLY